MGTGMEPPLFTLPAEFGNRSVLISIFVRGDSAAVTFGWSDGIPTLRQSQAAELLVSSTLESLHPGISFGVYRIGHDGEVVTPAITLHRIERFLDIGGFPLR